MRLHGLSRGPLLDSSISILNASTPSSQTISIDLVSPGHTQVRNSEPHSPLPLQRDPNSLRSPSKVVIAVTAPNLIRLLFQKPPFTFQPKRASTHHRFLLILLLFPILGTPTIIKVPDMTTIEPLLPQALIHFIMYMTRPRRR